MKQNMGSVDRMIRLIGAVAIVGLYFAGLITGILAVVLLVISIILVGTSLVRVCPLYIPFRIRTNKYSTLSK